MKNKIILMGIPHHNNLGDSAIAYAEERFIKDNFKQYNYFFLPQENLEKCIDKIKGFVKQGDIIFMHGGGNMGCEYLIVEQQRRKVVETFKENKIIFFPQTIYFKNNVHEREELENSKKIYSKHPNLTIIAREEESYKIMKKNFKNNNVILTPDMVTYLDESSSTQVRNGAILLLRKDKEKILKEEQTYKIKEILSRYYDDIRIDDTVRGKKLMKDSEREERLQELFDLYRKAEIVITDRLHGMIFAAITQTTCIALDNYNHKVRETAKWFKNLGYIKYIKDINAIEKEIINIRKNKKCNNKYNNEFAKKELNKIVEIINE